MRKFQCLVCGGLREIDRDDPKSCDLLRRYGWQISADHEEAVCPGCIRDIHEDAEEAPSAPTFLTREQIKGVARVTAPHTHEPESETGNVPGVVRHLASTLKNLDSREIVRPITELQEQVADAGSKRVEVACQCDEEAPNHHGGYGVCPKHGDFGDHLLVGDSVGGHQWQGASADFCLIDEAVDKPSIDEPDSFQDADDDTWERQEDGSYRMASPMGKYHHQPSLRAAVDYAGLQPDESLVLDALHQNTSGELARRNAKLRNQNKIVADDNLELKRRIEEQYTEMDERIWELKHQTQRHREVERNQSVALDEQDGRVRALQDEIARVVAERNELQETVQFKIQQQDEVRKMQLAAQERVAFLEETLLGIEKGHTPVTQGGRTMCPVCTGAGECVTHEEARAARTECGRPHPEDGTLLRCARSKSHLGLHRDTDERINATVEWDNDGNVM